MRRHVHVTDGPQRGKPIVLEPWQRQVLDAIDREKRQVIAIMGASQIGKTAITVGLACRAAADGDGVIVASATEESIRDLARRLDAILEASPDVAAMFPGRTGGPNSKSTWRQRTLSTGGWLSLAASGSASQLASRTARVVLADEVSRWPARVRSGEGAPLQLARMRLSDWGERARLVAISSPVLELDSISVLHGDGDRRRVTYRCPSCQQRTRLDWENVTGRGRGEVPAVACSRCGELHDERGRRKMLRSARWVPTVEAADEGSISFQLGRIDSARATLAQITAEWRRAERAAERGDPQSYAAFRNTVCGLPADSSNVDLDALYAGRRQTFDLANLEQVVVAADVQLDRLAVLVMGFSQSDRRLWVLRHAILHGDPAEPDVWRELEALAGQAYGHLRPSLVAVDAGFLTDKVRQACAARRWWCPVKGVPGSAIPIARPRAGATGLHAMGAWDASAQWSAAVAGGRVRLPATLTRRELAELVAGNVLRVEAGALKWCEVPGRQDHYFDAAKLCIWARRWRTVTGARRPIRLVAV